MVVGVSGAMNTEVDGRLSRHLRGALCFVLCFEAGCISNEPLSCLLNALYVNVNMGGVT